MAKTDTSKRRTVKENKPMNEETIDFRLTQIEKKLDTVTDLLLQSQAQEIRITTLEKQNGELKIEIENMKTQKSKNIDRWLNPLISTVISIIVAFVAIKIGLK